MVTVPMFGYCINSALIIAENNTRFKIFGKVKSWI